jgi:Cu2+-containing amine oxidase
LAFGDYHQVSGAGWSVYWRIPIRSGGGLEIWWADFQRKRVLWKGSQPFALVPYHRPHPGGTPRPPEHTYKDGLDPFLCGGAFYKALKYTAPNTWAGPQYNATTDTEAVLVENERADNFHSERLVISAKFQSEWYQYVHSWEFDRDGTIHPRVAMGGKLNPTARETAHLHHFYFRIDLDIDGSINDICEEFDHNSLTDPGGDKWTLITNQSKRKADSNTARNWLIRSLISNNPAGQSSGYEIQVPQIAGLDKYSTGDVWVTIYRGDTVQQGEDVGAGCTDSVLENVYAVGPLDTTNGSDIVLWVVVRAHHTPRNQGEESDHLPYHYEEFSIVPRNFT